MLEVPKKGNLWVDTDIAMGASFGDIDDGFAVAALALGVAGARFSACEGNSRLIGARRNLERILRLVGQTQYTELPNLNSATVCALGPLSNWKTRSADHLIVVGGYWAPERRPIWKPMEFNLTYDSHATRAVFSSKSYQRITLVPLCQARQLRVGLKQLKALGPGSLGSYLRRHSYRWLLRNILLKQSAAFAAWDLAAAAYLLWPELFLCEGARVEIHKGGFTWLHRDSTPGRVYAVTEFDAAQVWERFAQLVSRFDASASSRHLKV